jgi:capsule polysaccharide export protein KpsE/RkpR
MSSVKPVHAATSGVESEPSGRHLASPPPLHDAVEIARAARRKRVQQILHSMAIWVGVPTLLGLLYFGGVAANQYESFATFIVPTHRQVMLIEFLRSRDLLAQLDKDVHFSDHYKDTEDAFTALAPDAGSEQRYESFQRRVEARVGAGGVVRLRVRAYSAKSARQFGLELITRGRAFLATHSDDGKDHLLVISSPSLTSESTYPRRAYGVLATFLVSLTLYAIGSLLIAAAREHAQV